MGGTGRLSTTWAFSSLPASHLALRLLVDGKGLKLRGAGEWLVGRRGAKTRRSWRTLRIGMDADTGQIVAVALTRKEVDDGSQAGPLLDQMAGEAASFTADGAYGQDSVSAIRRSEVR